MKFLNRILSVALIAVASLAWVAEAEAKRLGGGKSMGRDSGAMQRQSTPPAAAPAQGAQQAAARPGAAPAATGSRWMAPLAGLAAGLGIAALASWLGFGEELASFMMIALLVVAAFVVFRLVMARRAGGAQPAFQGAGASGQGLTRFTGGSTQSDPQIARPGSAFSPLAASPSNDLMVPAGFDVDGFLRNAKVQFIRLQAANDAGDLDDLREFTSPEVFAELRLDISEREAGVNRTDVVTLDAELLGVETSGKDYLATVHFSGMIRENEGAQAAAFDEIWVLAKPVSGETGWVLSGIHQRN
jgi:predicted lipid-binding transport protein (Tim44 family)